MLKSFIDKDSVTDFLHKKEKKMLQFVSFILVLAKDCNDFYRKKNVKKIIFLLFRQKKWWLIMVEELSFLPLISFLAVPSVFQGIPMNYGICCHISCRDKVFQSVSSWWACLFFSASHCAVSLLQSLLQPLPQYPVPQYPVLPLLVVLEEGSWLLNKSWRFLAEFEFLFVKAVWLSIYI